MAPAFQARSKATIAALFTDLIDSGNGGDDETSWDADSRRTWIQDVGY